MKQISSTVAITAQEVYSKKEKAAWDKFEAVRDATYTGPGAQAAKSSAIRAARAVLRQELAAAEAEYFAATGS